MSSFAWGSPEAMAGRPGTDVVPVPVRFPGPATRKPNAPPHPTSGERLLVEVVGSKGRKQLVVQPSGEPSPRGLVSRAQELALLERSIRRNFIDEVVLKDWCEPGLARQIFQVAARNRADFKLAFDFPGADLQGALLTCEGSAAALTLPAPKPSPTLLWMKRGADCVLALLGLIALLPLMACIALAVKLDSAGPVFYRAPRAGKKGAIFTCNKFRTMSAEAENAKAELRVLNQRSGPFFKMREDPRITRIGRVLRRYSLDELPQLWNVITGDMSLVGPRPHPMDDFQYYEVDHFRRLRVIPGMTGLWQVSARTDPSFERSLELDLEYIEQWSLGLDLRILLRTFRAVLKGDGV